MNRVLAEGDVDPDLEQFTQQEFPWAGHLRLTRKQYEYATTRGRMPATFTDWQCLALVMGKTEADFKDLKTGTKKSYMVATARWNGMPAVQAQIEYERAISLKTRMAEPLRAWEARMEKLLAMAAGEMPQTRTVDTGVVRWRKEEGMQAEVPERILTTELYVETNLPSLSRALEMQGRALAIFKDKQEISGPDGAAAIQVLWVPPPDKARQEEDAEAHA